MSKTLKDLCFLAGVLLPPLAIALFFVVKNDVYKKAFKTSIFYGVVLWVMIALMLSLNMCAPQRNGFGYL
ncbi:MAG: hypothetical protein K2I78_01360 [Clostridia bacterium]|nr:hypothetical protein [Clostridia bacterium]MDE7215433.1 hypothetical protein [Clostridia bacterium]